MATKQPAKEGEKRPLPGSYSEMYPNRFIKADMLKGAKVTLTIKNIVGEGLMSNDGGANIEWVVSFTERPLEFVMNKTNAFCLYRMFGGEPKTWIGRKVTIFPTTTMAFGEKHDCIRVWGSPELTEDIPITVPQGRKKVEMVMHRVVGKSTAAVETAASAQNRPPRDGLPPRILAGLAVLPEAQADEFLAAHSSYSHADMLAALNKLLDEAA